MRRLKQLLWLVAVLIFTAILSFQTATAIFINDIGRDEYVTYFRGQFFTGYAGGTNAGAVFPFPAYTLVNDVNQFVQLTHDYLFNPVPDPIHDANDQIGAAAYVVSSMLGRKGPEFGNDWNVGVQYAKDNWADWESRVRYYDSQGWVNYNDVYTFCSPYVHYNQDYTLSDVFAYEVSSGGCQTDLAITFSRPGPGGGFYRLIKDCGNPNGDQTPLVDPPPPVTASCQPLTPYSSTIMGQPYTFAVSAQVSAWGPPLVSGNPALSVTVRDPGGAIVPAATNANAPYAAPPNGTSPATITSNNLTFVPTVTGNYSITWGLNGNGITLNGCSHNPTFGFTPFFSSVGGDIVSGGTIQSWNQDGASGSYAGAGSQLAALATGLISNFVTGSGLSGGAATNTGSGLTLANDATVKSNPTYGGNYTTPPLTNYAATAASQPGVQALYSATPDLATLASGIYTYDGNVTLTGQVPLGKDITIVVTGANHHIYISGNLTYPAYATFAEIPRLNAYATDGNIYVKNDVTEMHGVYYAGGSGTNGNFYSCSDNINLPVDLVTDTAGYDKCNHPLTVYGAVAATKLVLSRTYGHLIAVPGVPASPAETFYYSPELWMTPGYNAGGNTSVHYDSYRVLPPVL